MSDDDGDRTAQRGWRAEMRERAASAIGDSLRPGVLVRIQYALYLFIALVMCLILRGTMGKIIEAVPYLKEGCTYAAAKDAATTAAPISWHNNNPFNHHGVDTPSPPSISSTALSALSHACYENTVVYRVSFALALFYLLQFLAVSDVTCCIPDQTRAECQAGFFSWKSALLALLNFIVYWIPNEFFVAYAWVCMFVSAVFLVIQILLIIDFAYEWNEDWGDRAEENGKWTCYLLVIAILTYVFGIASTVYNFINFTPHGDCNLHGFVILSVLLPAILYTAIAVYVPHGSIVPSGIVFAYTSFIAYSAMRLSTDQRCNLQYTPPGSENIKTLLLMAVISGGALAYSVVSAGASSDSLTLGDDNDGGEGGDEARPVRRNGTATGHLPGYCYFHLIMLMGAMYLAMLATDWRVNSADKAVAPGTQVKDITATNSAIAFWVKISTCWLTIGAYVWSLVAPYTCCKHRDFGYDAVDGW